jgi:2-keto-4-pentenoate hydratase/2-oxohepta-3-ene-1,7-dioic acid hydratase in catechol pathway
MIARMRLLTFIPPGAKDAAPHVGVALADDRVLDLNAALGGEAPESILEWFDLDRPWVSRARELATNPPAASLRALADLRLLAPVPRPGKLICIGLNYRDHAIESKAEIPKSPIIFSKFTTAVTGPGDPIVLPATSRKVDYEAELAVIIGRRTKGVTVEHALQAVLGYANLNDVSARDFQFADGQWQRGKSCDTFAPFGPWIVTADEVPNPQALRIRFRLNGETLQDSSTSQLIFGVAELIAFLSESITLEPGDVIATGTPPGVGFARRPPIYLKHGDVGEVEVEGLGVLRNPVIDAAPR